MSCVEMGGRVVSFSHTNDSLNDSLMGQQVRIDDFLVTVRGLLRHDVL